jgi:DNA-binding protein H-NS
MTKVVADFEALPLEAKLKAYSEITAVLNAAKEVRRSQLEAEIRGLGFKPGEGKKSVKVKYRGPSGETWSGVGAIAGWLKKLKDAGEDIEKYRVTGT